MTLDQIAKDMGETRASLREQCPKGKWSMAEKRCLVRRKFIHRAFTQGHTPEAIGEYLDRSQTMVTHALRMIAVNELHAEYGQTLAELRLRLTGEAA